MVLVIDTSSALAGLALVDREGFAVAEKVVEAGAALDLPRLLGELAAPRELSAVAVAVGPGSFTGLRAGASYGLGLALGLGVPLLGLRTLELAAARAAAPATGLSEAGRGRVYHQAPGAAPLLSEPAEVPRGYPAVGWLRPATAAALTAAGVHLLEERELRSFGTAAAGLLGAAAELGYDKVKLEYMQSFGPLKGSPES